MKSSIDTLYHASGTGSRVAVASSKFSDMTFEGSQGTLVSSGYVEKQDMVGCSISNVSRPQVSSHSVTTIAGT